MKDDFNRSFKRNRYLSMLIAEASANKSSAEGAIYDRWGF